MGPPSATSFFFFTPIIMKNSVYMNRFFNDLGFGGYNKKPISTSVAINFIGWPQQSFKPQWFPLPVSPWIVLLGFHRPSLDRWVNTNRVATVLPSNDIWNPITWWDTLPPFYSRRHYLNSPGSYDSSPGNRKQVLIVFKPNYMPSLNLFTILFQDVFSRVHRGYI